MNQKWKTLIISLLTPSSIISGIALIVLWGYFSRLGRLDIFFDVMNIKSILTYRKLKNQTIPLSTPYAT
ncbi:hypothetical protein ACEONI_004510 [Escherichia coli]